jgi:hypothetical protein
MKKTPNIFHIGKWLAILEKVLTVLILFLKLLRLVLKQF